MVFAKNQDGGILPQTRNNQRYALLKRGYTEQLSNYNKYKADLNVLEELNKQLDNNGQAITDTAQRQAKANEITKDASQRAKDYGRQIATNASTLTKFKEEYEVEKPAEVVAGKWTSNLTSGLKGLASSGLSMIGNAVISATTAMIAEQLISWGLQGIDALVHWDENIIAKGQEAKESIESQTEAYEDQKTSLGELSAKYSELAKGVKISGNSIKNISLTDDQYQEFLDTSNQIASAAPSLTRSWDSQGNAILNAGTNTEELNTQVNDYLDLQRNLTYYNTKDNISKQYDGYKTTLKDNQPNLDTYQRDYDTAKARAESAQAFFNEINRQKQKKGTFDYTMDQETYDSLGETIADAVIGETPVNGKVTLTLDASKLSDIKTSAGMALESANEDLVEAQSNLTNVKESNDAAKREMISSIKSMASTIDSFDSWDDQDKASTFQSKLNTMLSSSDADRLFNDFEQSGKDMNSWLRSNIVNPLAKADPSQQELWSQLFEMEPKDEETVRDFAARRDNILESIADISQSDFWTKDTLAEAFGFAHTEYDDNNKAKTVWENQDSLNQVEEALKNAKSSKIKGDASDVREALKDMTPDELEIAVQVVTNSDEALESIDEFYKEFDKARQAAKDSEDEAAVSLDSMETKVTSAKSTLSSMSSILTETTSTGGVSKDNAKILTAAFEGVEDTRGIKQNVNKLFTTTSDGIKLNVDALKTFTEYQQAAVDKDFEKGIKLQTKAISEQAEETKKAYDAWQAKKETEEEADAKVTYETEKDKLDDARDEYLSYMQSQSEWQTTKKQQQELLSYYTQWQRAQSTENAGDKYNNIYSGLQSAKDAYDKGLVGTDDFKTFAALISPTGSDDRANFAENYGKAVRYLTEDKTGVNNFLTDLKAKGMASYDKSNDRWSFDIDNMAEAARSMGISEEFMSANFGRLRDYGIDNNFISSTEEGIDRVQELTSALSDEQKRLEELKNTDSGNTTAIKASEDKVNQYKQDLKETYDNMGSYSEDAAQEAVDNFNSAAMGVQSYQEAIDRVKKNENLTEAQRTSAINQLIAKQEELAATYGTTVDALLGEDVSSFMDGIVTDSASVTTALDGINRAYSDQNTEVTSLADTLSQYTAEQLEGIDFNDGEWDTELGDAEKAVESLCEKLGLTKDQVRSVIEALEEAGKLKGSEKKDSSESSSWEEPKTAEQMGFGDDPERAAEYTHSLEALTAAHKENDAATEESFETLSKYNHTQLEGIKLGDGAYNVEGMEEAEDALQQLADKTQLSKDQILTALEGLGVLKVNTPSLNATEDLDKLVTEAKTAQDELSELTGKTYSFDFDTTDLNTAHKQVSDLQEEVDKYKDRDGNFHSEYAGGEQVQSMYKAAIAQEQNVEYNSSAIGQSSLSSDVVQAAQNFMQAKNEMDQQTQLYQNGMDNTLDQATQDANTAFETLQKAQTDSGVKLIDTDNIQTAEDQLLQLSNEEISSKIKMDIDTAGFDDALAAVRDLQASGKMGSVDLNFDINTMSIDDVSSKIEELTNQKNVLTILGDVEGADKVQALIDVLQQVHDKQVEVVAQTQGVDLVDQLQSRISELQDKDVSIDAIVQDAEVSDLVAQIAALPPEVQIAIGIDESNVGNAEAIKAQIESDPASVTVNYTKGEEPEKADDIEGIANYTLGEHPTEAPDISGVANYTLGSYPTTAPTIFGTAVYTKTIEASGTMTSVAHASGTAYNVLNMEPLSPAHAKGEVALKHDEQALVNEVGINGHSESIVRDGVWSLIPGGAHIENLKKGDIIFSATQTDALLKHGAIQGHARAYAQGTVGSVGIMNAYSSGSSSSSDDISDDLKNALEKLSDNVVDWAETFMERLKTITSKFADAAESGYGSYSTIQKYYDKAIKSTKTEMKAAKKSAKKYKAYAEAVAQDPTVSKYLTSSLKKKVQNGTIDIESLSADQKKAVEAYKEWYDKYLEATQTYREKKTQKLDYAKAKVDAVYEHYGIIIGKREAAEKKYAAKAENRTAHWKSQNVGSTYYTYLEKELKYAKDQKTLTAGEIKSVKEKMADYLATTGNKRSDKAYQQMLVDLAELKTTYIEADTHIQELTQTLQDTREAIKQWEVDRWDRAGSKQDASIDYRLVTDNPDFQIVEKDYTERIKTNNRQIVALQKLRQEKAEYYDANYQGTPYNDEAQEYLKSIAEIDEQIMSLGASTEELKNTIMELRWKPFEDVQDNLSNVITEYQTMQKLLGDSDSFYNDDGSFTENGLTNILLTQESIDATKQKIANYREALNKLDKQYKNGCYSQEEYNEKSQELISGIQQESSALSDLQQNMLSMYETQVTKENELLKENIDKRLEALDAKEKYYDYDKTLKKKSKDINTLKAQIAALEGASNAAAKARLEKLKAELSESEEDMQDTVHNHEVEMKKTGFQNLQTEAETALDNTLDALKKNTSFQEAVINNMLTNVTTNYDSTYSHLQDVMTQYGVKVSSTFDTLLTKSANFNTSLVSQTKAMQEVINMATKLPVSGVSNGQGGTNGAADEAVQNTANNNQKYSDAGKYQDLSTTTYTLNLNAKKIYLTKKNKSYSLKATWKPSAPEHNTLSWKSSNEKLATVNSSGKVTAVTFNETTKHCTVTVTGGGGLAVAKCTVYVVEDAVLDGIDSTELLTGKTLSQSEREEVYQYAEKNTGMGGHVAGKYGATTALLNTWFKNLPDRPEGTGDIPSGTSELASYFMKKGKKVNRYNLQELAEILWVKTPGADKYENWGSNLKNEILRKYKTYGFAKGGVINKLIPADMGTLLGKAIIDNGDQGFIGAKVGESVMTEEFTRLLKPSISAMNAFTSSFGQTTPMTTTSNDYTVNNAVNVNVANMSSELDIQDVANKVSTIINKNMTRDWRKLR